VSLHSSVNPHTLLSFPTRRSSDLIKDPADYSHERWRGDIRFGSRQNVITMPDTQKIAFRWIARMAWRDSRKSRSRLFLFISSIIIGIAALVAIFSLGDNLAK